MVASERAFNIIRAAAERLAALAPPSVARPAAMMMALHIWSMSHGMPRCSRARFRAAQAADVAENY